MPSLVTGFAYDIFISYRQNDNRSAWVTEFVSALEEELAATIKDPVSIYFDINPHDGLLETHRVDKSLEGKLKCLIFIPIISQTYCDPKGFAWQNEFCVFNKLAKEDQFGTDIKLNNGNVASRILPVIIHELDPEDKAIIVKELGTVLRGIEFIYKEPGVNRPLAPSDRKNDNVNKIDYRNQQNKIAYAIRDIVRSLKDPQSLKTKTATQPSTVVSSMSIAVLPFVNMSKDADQEYFSDGLTEEIITHLSSLKSLLVISRGSVMTFKNSQLKIPEIAQQLNVQYALEGSVRKSGNDLRITAQLIDATTDTHLWAETYTGQLTDIFKIQEQVAMSITHALKVKLTQQESELLTTNRVSNAQAYELFQRAQYEFYFQQQDSLLRSVRYLQEALNVEEDNAFLYAKLGFAYCWLFNISNSVESSQFYREQAHVCAAHVLRIEGNSSIWNGLSGFLAFYEENVAAAMGHLKKALQSNPNDVDLLVLIVLGDFYQGLEKEMALHLEVFKNRDPLNPIYSILIAMKSFMKGDLTEALALSKLGFEKYPAVPQVQLYYAYFLAASGQSGEAVPILKKFVDVGTFAPIGELFLRGLEDGAAEDNFFSSEAERKLKLDCEWCWLIADFYALAGNRRESFRWLEYAVNLGFINYPLLVTHDPFLKSVKEDEGIKNLLTRVAVEWESAKGNL